MAVAFVTPLALGLVPRLQVPAVVVEIVLGIIIPVLKEGGHSESQLGQLVFAGASIGDFAAVILLSLLFSRDSTDLSSRLVLLIGFVVFVGVLAVALTRRTRSMAISKVLLRLQDSTAQIRVRGAMLLLILLVVAAEQFGLEAILGAFVAGAVLGVVDRDA